MSDEHITGVIRDNGSDLLGYFLRRVQDPEQAADLLADLFVVIWRRRKVVPTTSEDARKWCFGVARNVLREHHRGRTRRNDLADALRDHLETIVADPARVAEDGERDAAVRAAVRSLDARSRELVVLLHWDGFTIADAAAHLGMNPSTARTRYARARTRLAQLLTEGASQPSVPAGESTAPV
ncbi:sigma-70 family RNA polymerase sigma factor [Microbacterium sp. KUDC0406]|uniref:RNA polymerase sigma factor n=1 Tax=Microbacterium sp. KUDC0406 TaxID=2909588 RepID=UPI001F3090C5|nr:sigma-70 family RNA polymerase sigma factor [Microbacterium sp. KUDC0406]UJP10342.1 sigma-70 family RNA polymerase sigma factor [Microbacterium sp. KUDC0406]